MSAIAQGLPGQFTRPLVAANHRPAGRDTLDDALIERIAAGDRSAVNVLYARHSVRIYRFILRIVGNEAVAEELANEVFLHVWRKAGMFEGRSQVSTWLLAVARHKALGALRSRSTEPLDRDAAGSIADPGEDPEAAHARRETGAILRDCLAQLSPLHRQIIDLVYYHGQTIGGVAQILDIPQSTVKTRMFYARRQLAELLRTRGIATAAA